MQDSARQMLKCIEMKMYQAAIAQIAVLAENVLVDSLLAAREKIGDSEYLLSLNNKALSKKLISQKTHDRISILNKLRRFGTHHKKGVTLEQDARFSYGLFKEALSELASAQKAPTEVLDLQSSIDSIEALVREEEARKSSLLYLVHSTVEDKSQSYYSSVDWVLRLASPPMAIALAMIVKYEPSTVEELMTLLRPFNISEYDFVAPLRSLMISGIIHVEHPHDRKRFQPIHGRLTMDNYVREEMERWFKVNWRLVFHNYEKIEPSFEHFR